MWWHSGRDDVGLWTNKRGVLSWTSECVSLEPAAAAVNVEQRLLGELGRWCIYSKQVGRGGGADLSGEKELPTKVFLSRKWIIADLV